MFVTRILLTLNVKRAVLDALSLNVTFYIASTRHSLVSKETEEEQPVFPGLHYNPLDGLTGPG